MSPAISEKFVKHSETTKQIAPHTFEGKVVSISGSRLESVSKGGRECSHTLAPNAWLTFDGVICQPADLKIGRLIRVTTRIDDKNVVTAIEMLN